MRKKLLAIIAATAMVVAMMPGMVFADGGISTEDALKEAVKTEKSVALSGNIQLTSPLEINGEVTLDLGTYNITPGDGFVGDSLIIVNRGGSLTVTGSGTIDANNPAGARVAIKLTKDNESEEQAGLTVNGGHIKGASFGISGNGTRHGTQIAINGGTVEGSVGIYHPQEGELTVTGGTIKGETGIEMRSGKLTVNGGEIVATGELEVTGNGNGSTTTGVAVAVAQHTTLKPINVVINGGNLSSGEKGAALYISNPQGNDDVAETVAVTLNGGIFDGYVCNVDESEGANEQPAGALTINAAILKGDYNFEGNVNENWIAVEKKGVSYIDYIGEAFVKEGLATVKAGDIVEVYGIKGNSIEVPEGTLVENLTEAPLTINGKEYPYTEPDENDNVAQIIAPAKQGVSGQTKPEEPKKDTVTSPETGDNFNAAVPLAVAGLALSAMAVVVATRKRHDR